VVIFAQRVAAPEYREGSTDRKPNELIKHYRNHRSGCQSPMRRCARQDHKRSHHENDSDRNRGGDLAFARLLSRLRGWPKQKLGGRQVRG
jgi:hypothetical protein